MKNILNSKAQTDYVTPLFSEDHKNILSNQIFSMVFTDDFEKLKRKLNSNKTVLNKRPKGLKGHLNIMFFVHVSAV